MKIILFIVFLLGVGVVLGAAPNTTVSSPDYEIEAPTDPSGPADTLFITEDGDTITKAELDSIERANAIAKLPELREFIKAVYPAQELKSGVEATVTFDLFVSDSGAVDSLHVVKGASPVFDSAAATVVRRFRFTPALTGAGMAVPVIVQYEYRFSVAEEVKAVEEYVNLTGVLREKGTRAPIREGMIVLSFLDTAADTTLKIPWSAYLRKIGSFEGQFLDEDRLATLSDTAGRFAFKSLPVGKIKVTFPVSGYVAAFSNEIVEPGKKLEVDYALERLSYNEYEIVVYGKAEKKEVGKSSLTLAEVKRVPGFGGDAVKVVQALPGVARASFISGQVIVRGSGNGDTRYFLDGVEIPLLFHFGGLRSTYNSDALASIDLYPGGFNARYGGCVGGVVEIKGRPPKSDRWHGIVDVNLIDASFLAEGPLAPRWDLLVTARRSYIANVAKWAIDAAGITVPVTVVPYYWDLVTRLNFSRSRTERLFWTLFLSQDRMDFIIKQARGGSGEVSDAQNTLSQDVGADNLLFGWDRELSDALKNELRFCLQRTRTNFNIFGFARMDMTAYGPYLRDQLSWKLSPQLTLTGGLDAQLDTVNYDLNILSAQGARESGQHRFFSDLGTYALAEFRPIKSLTVTPGLRYDYYAEIGEGAPSLRLTTRWNLRPGHTAKAAVGTYNQSPEPMGQAIDPVWGNPDLPVTRARHAVAGYEYRITDLISADIQAYYNRQYDIPQNTDSFSLSTFRQLNFLPDEEGRMYGLELMLRHDPGQRFFGWVAYSLSKSERRSPRRPSGQGGGQSSFNRNSPWNPAEWYLFGRDQTHNLQIVGSWRLPKNWEAGFRLRYVTGNPVTPNLGYTDSLYAYNAEYGYYTTLQGEPLSDRMGPFFQLDARVDKKFIYRNWILSAYLDVQNMNYFFYNSPETYQYNYDDSDRQTIGGIIIPSLGIRAEF